VGTRAPISGAEQARNVILSEPVVRDILSAAYKHSAEFGLLVEVAAVTGARYGQIAGLKVADLQADSAEPRLMMPSSRKGKKGIRKPPRPVPIPAELAERLRALTSNQHPTAPLLTKPISGNWRGGPWKDADHDRPFEQIVHRCGLSNWEARGYPAKVTIYALRHSDIVRQIGANVPLRIIAGTHDTSVAMIERHYSRFITDHTDAITRAALLDTSKPLPQRAAS
jgi:integrase